MRRPLRLVGLAAALSLGIAAVTPGCAVQYVVSSGFHQAELLASRRPVATVLAEQKLSAGEEQRLRLVPRIKDFGRSIGLAATDNYETYADGWNRVIYNVSASKPLRFENRTWWFPIVGRVPYLGFFSPEDARVWVAKLDGTGDDVWMRTAGAYSTLGWFKDPVLPAMLRWSEADLAETILHELAHSTLWIPGSVSFNETFANVVGEEAGHQYMVATYGADSPQLQQLDGWTHDSDLWREVLMGVYKDLDTAYTDPALDDAAKARRKAEIIESIPGRVEAADFRDGARYLAAAKAGPWNNARLLQYRTYNTHEAEFRAILARNDNDILAFIEDVGRITKGADDPAAAILNAVQNP